MVSFAVIGLVFLLAFAELFGLWRFPVWFSIVCIYMCH